MKQISNTKFLRKAPLFVTFTLSLTAFHTTPVIAASPFCVNNPTPHWSYSEATDPTLWASISCVSTTPPSGPEAYPYSECLIGSHQSPVILTAVQGANHVNELKMKYGNVPLFIQNTGHTVQMGVSGAYLALSETNSNFLLIGEEKYTLQQYHVHAPSENRLNSTDSYPMELHFVHGTPDGKLAVLGVFVKGGGSVPNAEFDKILNNLPTEMQLDETGESANVTDPDDLVTGVNVDIKKLLPKNKKKFFAYAGSLTTPPCSEGVNWYVLAEPIVVSDEQITKYQSYANSYGFFPGNRPTQLIGDRKVIQPNVNSMDWGVVE